ncbi:OmpP1/FadL family transporter [Aquiflexum gelatinilyticum]|uniref:Outer membrane protein transport protein n=1 Tax=Aquiflexum gelatinilyticum TaxID=2961943 RepID=A0A9X2T228_9BACT|nr:outer membrane protein transport protein [Aquiflexum gelatinilyticum]MCR9017448.1 outer membrane protein transport protein [Aquiflexum gelatinilyticum]
MISKKHLLLGIFMVFLGTSTVLAQFGYYEDALRFSQFRSTGSARIIGLGGAQMSLGGDISNIHTNPAGLGFFRRSEFSFSSAFGTWNTESNYLGQIQDDRTGNFSIPNLSLVISNPRQGALNTNAFKGGSFGISFNRMNYFNSQFGYFSDVEGDVSIIDFFLQQANGIPESQIENFGLTGLAYQTFLINPIAFDSNGNPINNPSQYDSFVLGFPFQDETVITDGRISQTSISYGANFLNKFFIGGGLGLSSVRYSSRKNYREEFFDEPLLNSTIDERLTMSGFGANINLGIIFKPIDQLNLGVNFQSPTWYNFNEQYEARMVNNFDNFFFEDENITLTREEASTPITIGNYNLNTPLRLSGGATIFLGKSGFITADIDYLDYSKSRINSRDFNAGADNQQIRALFGQTLNYRVGGEFRFDIWRVRGGYGFYGDPFVNSSFDRRTQQYSGGLGVRLQAMYVDFALTSTNFDQLYNSFPVEEGGFNIGPFTEIRNNITSGILTFGFNF